MKRYVLNIVLLCMLAIAFPSSISAQSYGYANGTLETSVNQPSGFDMCRGVSDAKCEECKGDGDDGVWTAIGCLPTDPKGFVAKFLSIAIGIAGGIALLLMVYGAFLVSASAGDPKKADEGKEIITGTIAGLLFIIFSVFLLRLIGVQILDIPGF